MKLQRQKVSESSFATVDSKMFARTSFSLIFANTLPREFKVLPNIAILFNQRFAREFKNLQIYNF